MINHDFCKSRRLKKPEEFSAVYRYGQNRIKGQYFVLLAFCRDGNVDNIDAGDIILKLLVSRVGIVVSKKVSKLAVQRNRIKRLVREQFRQNQQLKGFDFVIIAKSKAATVGNKQLINDLNCLWEKSHKKIKKCAIA